MKAQKIKGTVFGRLPLAVLIVAFSSTAAGQEHGLSLPLLASRVDPAAFGVLDETRTVISATSFLPSGTCCYRTSPSFGRYLSNNGGHGEFYATLDLPAGAVIDFIGINSTTDTDAILGLALWERDRAANMNLLEGFSIPAHGWDTDFAGPLGIQITDHVDKELVLNVEQALSGSFQFFAWVEVWWHRTVSPAPATASFNDVPTNHPFFQFVEALKASGITGGCGDGTNYCPDSPLTRGQMAVFLAKALGLHWAN